MRYNYETNDFTRLNFPDGRKPRIYSIVENHCGDILLGTAGYGLYSVKKAASDKAADKQFLIKQERQYAERDSVVFFTHIYEDQHHYLWQSSHLSTFTRFIENKGKVNRKDFKSHTERQWLSYSIVHKPCSLYVCMASSIMTIRRAE